jgi:hypothetical protein
MAIEALGALEAGPVEGRLGALFETGVGAVEPDAAALGVSDGDAWPHPAANAAARMAMPSERARTRRRRGHGSDTGTSPF